MKINLNNPLVVGTMSDTVNDQGHHTFTRWGESHSRGGFLAIAQYLIDGIPDVSAFVVVDVETQTVFRFSGLVFDALHMESKRYKK